MQLVVVEQGGYGGRRLHREATGSVRAGCEGVRAVVEHELGELGSSCLYAEVAEHCVRFPAAKQHDGVGASVGTEQGRSPAGSKRASRDELRVNASHVLDGAGSVAWGVGDEGWSRIVPSLGSFVVVPVDGSPRRGAMASQP